MLGFIVAFAVTKKRHLRDEKGLQELAGILNVQDLRNIQESEHMPLYCLDVLTNYLRIAYSEKRISDHVLQLMDNNITTFQDTLGGCERIKKTPIPVAFVVHMRNDLQMIGKRSPRSPFHLMAYNADLVADMCLESVAESCMQACSSARCLAL